MPPHPDEALIARLSQQAIAALRAHLEGGQACALVDFPDHSNVGDSAIWLGEIEAIKAITGLYPAYSCALSAYDAAALKAAVPEGPILIHGGGNFGDLWPEHQDFREQICLDFPDRVIVQLPQSIHFKSEARKAQAQRILGAHGRFFLWARDQDTLSRAQEFDVEVSVTPDMAFVLGPLHVRRAPWCPLVALLRIDQEKTRTSRLEAALPAHTRHADWLEEEVAPLWALEDYLAGRVGASEGLTRLAEVRVARGLELLASGHRVLSDRLHAHILSLLLGRPHFALDSAYGKVFAFIESWTKTSALTTCGDEEAFQSWWIRQDVRAA
jgi:exopolysaccharide biosynthesis predicted pyruvyltransferase EpsI